MTSRYSLLLYPNWPAAVTRHDIVRFMDAQDQAGLKSTTINRRLAALSSLFAELGLLDAERFPRNLVQPAHRLYQREQPTRQVTPSLYRRQPQRIPAVFTQPEMQQFFAALPTWRDRTLMLLMWISTLRIGEALGLQFADVECSRRCLTIRPGKNGHGRVVYMDPTTFASLNRYLDEERGALFPDEPSLFVAFKGSARGRPLTVNAVQHLLVYYAHKCGIPDLHAHRFRHTGITQLVEQGVKEPVIRQIAGHRSPKSLEPYLHLADDFVRGEFDRTQAGLRLDAMLQLTASSAEHAGTEGR
ncbi:MAG TPA: site-specific integrase [Herpetosiphonaceae bacterium]|nr:site-specific integrase [Herpetosiphonaceae bacterium]